MSPKRRKDTIRTMLADAWRESGKRLALAARIILETTIIYLLFLSGDLLILGVTRLAFGAGTPLMANLREGVEMLSVIAIAIGYVFHVMDSLRYHMPPSKLEGEPDFAIPYGSLKQIEETYNGKIQIMDEVIKQLRQQSLKSVKR